ncbi:hypothetical protein WMF18_02815 [Sorangium sp. So ce315]|uniref:hypothetical protein n=1 Tax=Sorangium sp. So ce315 TaxID=3133299 RepID=UPI003F5DF99F
MLSASLAATIVSAAGAAHADVTIAGDVLPQNPTDPWDLGSTPLLVGGTMPGMPAPGTPASGEVIVSNRGTLITAGAILGGESYEWGHGRVEVIGYGSTWTNHGAIELTRGGTLIGELLVRRGATVTTDDLMVGAVHDLTQAYVTVEGYDATLTSRANTYIGYKSDGTLRLKQGASFFSNNVYFGGRAPNFGYANVAGSGTRWVATGDFIVGTRGGAAGRLDIYRGELSTVNAWVQGSHFHNSYVRVSGWGGTWTNQGLLLVGTNEGRLDDYGYGEVAVGAYGTLMTDDTEICSGHGKASVKVNDVYASWINRGDVTIAVFHPASPALLVDGGGTVSIGGLLRTGPLPDEHTPHHVGPAVRLANGDLTVGAIEVREGDFDFAGGRLETGSFVGDLANLQAGELSVGEAHPSTGIVGSYSQGPDATLSITVASSSALPLLEVDGDLILNGALEVVPADGSVSFEAGATIALLGWSGDLAGAFADVNIALPLAPGLAWDTSALYTTGEITVVPAT